MAARESNLDRLLRMRDLGAAGEPIGAQDARHLASWVDRAVARNTTLDDGADLGAGWQDWVARQMSQLSNWAGANSFRQAARELRAELGRYIASRKFDQHLASTSKPTDGREAELYVLAIRYRGLPSEETLRKDIAAEAMRLSP